MSTVAAPDESDHHSLGLIIAAVLSWIPPIAVVVSRLISSDLPARVPTHWSVDGKADGWSSIQGDFWTTLPVGAAGAVLVTVIVIFGGNNIPRIKGSLGLAGIVLVSAGISFLWFVSIAITRRPDTAGPVFGLFALSAIILAGLVFVAGALPRRKAPDPIRSSAFSLDR
ncbi:DUF1648 domain-containing protein [Rathayibacter sp. KR2-224]|uniref:DUF1648 domain-containing protein n=1 Tax=Rathayibacter sp. KR2-224 TaxID=3400913 RepID=UPI003C07C7C4